MFARTHRGGPGKTKPKTEGKALGIKKKLSVE